MAKKQKENKQVEKSVSWEDIIKASVSGNPKPKDKASKKVVKKG